MKMLETENLTNEEKSIICIHGGVEMANENGKVKRGRPVGSKNKPKIPPVQPVEEVIKKKRGRPTGSKNKPKIATEEPKPEIAIENVVKVAENTEETPKEESKETKRKAYLRNYMREYMRRKRNSIPREIAKSIENTEETPKEEEKIEKPVAIALEELVINDETIEMATCENCGSVLITDEGKTICPVCSVHITTACTDCGGLVFTEGNECMCSNCGKVFYQIEAKKEVVVKEVFTEEIEKIIKAEHNLFSTLSSKYANYFNKEDLYNDLVIKTFEIYQSQANRFNGYTSDFRNFLIRSLKNYCLNYVTYAERHGKKESNQIPENYSITSTAAVDYKGLTAREQYLLDTFDMLDTEKYSVKKWDSKKLLSLVCKDIAKKENTDPHYILREFKVLATKLA